MNPKLRLYAVLVVVAVCAMGYLTFTHPSGINSIKLNYDNLANVKVDYENAKDDLERTKRTYLANEKRIKAEIQARERERSQLKPVYHAKRVAGMTDDTALFARMLQDTVKMVKRSGLKVSSIDFYTNISNQEPLLKGRSISIEDELNLMGASPNDNPQEESTATSEPAVVTDYKGYQVDFGFMGSYNSLNNFLKQLSEYKYFIKVKKIESAPYPKNQKILMSNVSLVFFVDTK